MKQKIVLAFLICSCLFTQAQIDSLKRIVSGNGADTLKMNAYFELVHEYLRIDLDTAEHYARTSIRKYEKSGSRDHLSDAYAALGTVYGYKRDFDNSLNYFSKALSLMKGSKNKAKIARAHYNIGLIHYFTASYQKGAEQYIEALKLLESIKDTQTLPTIYNGLGAIYKEMHKYGEALDVFRKCIAIYTENKDSVGLSTAYNNIGNVFDYMEKPDEALESYQRALQIKEAIGYERGMSSTLNNIGIILSKKDRYDEALQYFQKALSHSTGPNDDRISQAVAYDAMGGVYYKKKDYATALRYLEMSLSISKDIHSPMDLISCYEKIAACHGAKGNYKKAYEYQGMLLKLKDSVLNADNSKMVSEMAAKYETEKKELQIDNLNKDNKLKEEELQRKGLEIKQQNTLKIFFAACFILVTGLAFFIFQGYRQKKRSNEIISGQKKEVEHHLDIIEERNKAITDSIFYAHRIQMALLAGDALLKKHLPEFFVLYKPKDIVSGDLYWANTVDNKFYLCVADCTGHGVPGAFMSLLNISFLNEALLERKIDSPDKIFGHVRERIIAALNPEGTETVSRDGMDGVLCMFDMKGMWLRFACANNPVWLVRNNELKVFHPDKMPVGLHHGETRPFELHTLGLRKGDIIYLFTDGYADQFGGEKGKKFKYKNLQKILLENSTLPMEAQKNMLESTLLRWKGNIEQVDDILIIGIRV